MRRRERILGEANISWLQTERALVGVLSLPSQFRCRNELRVCCYIHFGWLSVPDADGGLLHICDRFSSPKE